MTRLPELLGDVLAGTIDPGRVFDDETDLEQGLVTEVGAS